MARYYGSFTRRYLARTARHYPVIRTDEHGNRLPPPPPIKFPYPNDPYYVPQPGDELRYLPPEPRADSPAAAEPPAASIQR